MLKENSVLLFQGDSITHYYRDLNSYDDLGIGYVNKIASYLDTFEKDKNLKVLNRGIGGNTAYDLTLRWQEDCIALKPDYVTILIGINDCCYRYFKNQTITAAEYESNYRTLLDTTKNKLNAQLIIIEPFVLHYPLDRADWREDLNPKIDVARKLAMEYQALYIPLDGLFAAAAAQKGCQFYSEDGVHPNDIGNAFIAKAWLQAVGVLN